ncbi:MAG: DnaJ domain-containing protein [Rhodoferax sp.]|nr:DnaJ domain-containing protein [Rhodoferax sp.]
MQGELTLYDTLEVSSKTCPQVISAAYRCLAQFNHPDKKPGSNAASERLAQINDAYAILSELERT